MYHILYRNTPVDPDPEPVEDLRNRFLRIDGDKGAGLQRESGPHGDSLGVNSSALSDDTLRDLLMCIDPAIFCSGISASPLIFSISAV
jgi:hypothetical protein